MKTKFKVIIHLLVFLFVSHNIFPQISSGGEPYSFKHSITKSIQSKEMEKVDVGALLREDEKASKDEPYRFGYGFDVNYNLKNSGSWIDLADGGKLWRLQIKSEGAYSVNLIYDRFCLPDGAEFFIYYLDKSMVIGAFTSRNNKPHGKFATGLVKGDEIILEYYEPSNVKTKGEISVSRIVHAYRNLFNFSNTMLGKITGFGGSGSCNNNVYCSEAEDWENEVHSVGMILLGNGTRWKRSIASEAENNIQDYNLFSNYPNPFNPTTQISYQIPKNSFVTRGY